MLEIFTLNSFPPFMKHKFVCLLAIKLLSPHISLSVTGMGGDYPRVPGKGME